MDYGFVKHLHQGLVGLSVTGFVVRGIASLAGATWVRHRTTRTLPHLLDTALLMSGVALAWMLRMDLPQSPWLVAKLLGLVVYVLLGVIALRPSRPRSVRLAAWLAALAVVAWMVSVAITKDPAGFLPFPFFSA